MFRVLFLFLLTFLSGCVKEYDFNVENSTQGIVIESAISNLSYRESTAIPADGHFFKVILAESSSVDNVKDIKINDALVYLKDSNGAEWLYTKDENDTGEYYLLDVDFKALPNVLYQLQIELKEGQRFESEWEAMPTAENTIGELSHAEVKPEKYIWEIGKRIIKEIEGLDISIQVPSRTNTGQNFLRWSYEPLWMHTAVKTDTRSPVRTCWVRSSHYQNGFVLKTDSKGGYNQNLFFLPTLGNDRLFQYFSTIIYQDLISEGYYSFWKDFEAQKDKGGLFDQPAFGLSTNFRALNNDWTVNGYFGVVSRKAVRWTFEPEELSYTIYNYLQDLCDEYGDPVEVDQCYDCRKYNVGEATTTMPEWWEKR